MNRPLRRLITVLTLTAAVTTGTTAVNHVLTPADTAWGAPALDNTTPAGQVVDGGTVPDVTPQDTAWG